MAKINTKSVIQFVVLLGLCVLLIGFALKQAAPQKQEIFNAFANANYFWVVVSCLVSLFSHFLRAYRWNYLLKPVGYKVDIVNATCHVLISYLANYAMRLGEFLRCTFAAKYDKVPFQVALGTVITERIVDFMVFILIFIISLITQYAELYQIADKYVFSALRPKWQAIQQSPSGIIIFLVVVILVVVLFLFLRKKVLGMLKGKLGSIIKGLLEGIGSIRKMDKPVQFILLSLAIWLCYFYSLYTCFLAFDELKNLGQLVCLTVLVFGTVGVIISPGGAGAYQIIVAEILITSYAVNKSAAIALPWLAWGSQFVLILVFAIISFIVLPIRNKKNAVSSAT